MFDKAKTIIVGALDLAVYLIKSLFLSLFLTAILGAIAGEDYAFYVVLAAVPASFIVCWKSYRRKRLTRKLAETNKEIRRLEQEIAAHEAHRQQLLYTSVSFVDNMEGHEFEHWCAALLLKIGFDSADVTRASGDDGVDIIATKENIRYAIQCKRYSSDLGNTPVQEVHAGKSVYNCHVAAVMTNRHFTPGGKKTAEATGTLLWDRDWIANKLLEIGGPAAMSSDSDQ